MRELTDIVCQCGSDQVYRYGSFLRCEACDSIYYDVCGEQSLLSDRYYRQTGGFDGIVDKIFLQHLSDLPRNMLAKIKVSRVDTIYVPYVNVIDESNCDLLVPVMNPESAGSSWKHDDVPVIDYSKLRNQFCDFEFSNQGAKIAECDMNLLETVSEKYNATYIGHEFFYVQLNILEFSYRNKIYKYIAYGDVLDSVGSSIDEIVVPKREDMNFFERSVRFLVTIALLACSWICCCWSFMKIHGFWSLFLWAKGYECIFRFLGLGVLIWLGIEVFLKYWKSIRAMQSLSRSEDCLKRLKMKISVLI